MTISKGRSEDYIPTLDGWRALAILAVIVSHAGAPLLETTGWQASALAAGLNRCGAVGVNVFFGISGFLICGRLLEEEKRYGSISLKNFYIRRAFRILPPYLLFLLVLSFVVLPGRLAIPPKEWLGCALFFRNYIDGSWYTAHFWSLTVEEHFYLFWPLALVLAGRAGNNRLFTASGIALAIGLWRPFAFRHANPLPFLPNASFYSRTDVRLDALLWGCWMALLYYSTQWRERLAQWMQPLAWLSGVAIFLLCVTFPVPLALTWQSVLIPILLVGTISHSHWGFSRILEWQSVRWIGRVSYGLYLWQQFFLAERSVSILGPWQQFPLNLAAVFLIATLSYYLLEKRMIRLGHRLTVRPDISARNVD